MRRLLVFVALFFSLPAQAVTIDWVPIGNANNPADTLTNCHASNCGSVDHAYYISKYETTNAQYAEFLNAKAAADPLALWSSPPFEPSIRDGKILGRGTSDDKGQLMTFVEAARAWKAVSGGLPLSVTILFEGEEESGSPSLKPFIAAMRSANHARAEASGGL